MRPWALGGEEFLIICSETELEEATAYAEALRTLIYTSDSPLPFPLSASFGVAQYRAGEEVDALVGRVDNSLYIAKRSGRNQVVSVLQSKAEKSGLAQSNPG